MKLIDKLAKIPFRLYEYAALACAIAGFVLWWDHGEIEKGRNEIRAEIEKAQKETQAKVDAKADEQNTKLQATYNASKYVPFDYTAPVGCGSVPDAIRLSVNASHKTH